MTESPRPTPPPRPMPAPLPQRPATRGHAADLASGLLSRIPSGVIIAVVSAVGALLLSWLVPAAWHAIRHDSVPADATATKQFGPDKNQQALQDAFASFPGVAPTSPNSTNVTAMPAGEQGYAVTIGYILPSTTAVSSLPSTAWAGAARIVATIKDTDVAISDLRIVVPPLPSQTDLAKKGEPALLIHISGANFKSLGKNPTVEDLRKAAA